jgi:hypothetical protein
MIQSHCRKLLIHANKCNLGTACTKAALKYYALRTELQNNVLLRRLTNCHTIKNRKPIPTTLSM